MASDGNGALSANTGAAGGGGTITPSNAGKTLTFTGTLAQVNADLTTLTDDDPTTPSDTISYTLSRQQRRHRDAGLDRGHHQRAALDWGAGLGDRGAERRDRRSAGHASPRTATPRPAARPSR